MCKKFFILLAICTVSVVLFFSFNPSGLGEKWSKKTSVWSIFQDIGVKKPIHSLEYDSGDVQRGYDLVHLGYATAPNGKQGKRQSKHFTCRSCHNVVREDENLPNPTPEGRIKYAKENDLPFLQGTTFWGIVNRKTFYNGDYKKKYGALVENARDTLVNAVHLCATECAQGRPLEDWETKAIMAYFWSLQLKLSDLDLTPEEWENLQDPSRETQVLLESKFLTASPATFKYPWKGMKVGYGENGNAEWGKEIYTRSCLHCHNPNDGVTNFTLDISTIDKNFLASKMSGSTDYSIYWVTRLGTKPLPGYKPYMPHYPVERLSDGQIEDLAAYLKE